MDIAILLGLVGWVGGKGDYLQHRYFEKKKIVLYIEESHDHLSTSEPPSSIMLDIALYATVCKA